MGECCFWILGWGLVDRWYGWLFKADFGCWVDLDVTFESYRVGSVEDEVR